MQASGKVSFYTLAVTTCSCTIKFKWYPHNIYLHALSVRCCLPLPTIKLHTSPTDSYRTLISGLDFGGKLTFSIPALLRSLAMVYLTTAKTSFLITGNIVFNPIPTSEYDVLLTRFKLDVLSLKSVECGIHYASNAQYAAMTPALISLSISVSWRRYPYLRVTIL